MIKQIVLNGKKIEYKHSYKNVKNINLRIKSDGCVFVSSSKRVSQGVIDDFLISKADLILNAIDKYQKNQEKPRVQYFGESEICDKIREICEKVYPYFQKLGVEYPIIKFRKMTSRWGSCQPGKGILTFNINLMYAPLSAVEYVVMHEFTHFLVANHSEKFYYELEKVCPDWKIQRKILREIILR